MESFIHERIMKHCHNNSLFTKAQHGFLPKRGCVSNLIEARDILTDAVHRGYAIDVIYTDFAKAFDKVPHKRLLHKLKAYGICGSLFRWISDWLANRKQRVVVGKAESEWKEVTSGVPQGSVLGPLLFILYINDLPDNIAHHIKIYADDSKILGVIKTEEDKARLQLDIDKAVEWSKMWLMLFNLDKCKCMHVGRNNKSVYVYTMTDQMGMRQELGTTSVERDLGVLISEDLKVKHQVEAAAARANQVLGRLKKSFRSRGLMLWKVLYKMYVRPHLEFAIQSWSPHLKRDINALENIQRRATKLITGIKHKPYEERLTILGLTKLEDRRVRNDLIQQYKIVHGVEKIEFVVPQVYAQTLSEYNLRGNSLRLTKQLVKNCIEREKFFANCIVNAWNALPSSVVNSNSTDAFKKRLDAQTV
jgi:hypothetical protein